MKLEIKIKSALLWVRHFGLEHLPQLLLGGILFAALGLRLWGVGFDLPNLYHPDEDALIMPAINIIKTGNLEPTRLEYGSLHIYILTAVSAIVFVLSKRNGFIGSVDQLAIYERGTFPAIYQHSEYFLAGRVVSAFMGVGVIFIVYLLARRLGNERQGLIAAAAAAFLPAMVADAHFATTDTPLMFWVILALYLLIRVYDNWDNDDIWAYAGAGFVCGLATSTKYNGIILVLPLLMTPILRVKSLDDLLRIRFLVGPLFMVAGFLVGTPFALLNLPNFLGWFGYSLRLYNAPIEPFLPAWQWHLNYHLTSPHIAIFIVGLIGFCLSFYNWGKRAIILNSFALALWFAIISQTNYQARMWLPSAPLFVMWASLVLEKVVRWLYQQLALRKTATYAAYLPLFILLFHLAIISATDDHNFQSGDVRTEASKWITQNIPPGTAIAGDYFMPNIDEAWPVTKAFVLYDKTIDWYKENGIEYFVMNEALNDFDRLPVDAQERYSSFIQSVCVVETIPGTFLGGVDLNINIYKIPPCN